MANTYWGQIELYDSSYEYKNTCKILGLEFEDCLTIGGFFWSERISKAALLLGNYLGFKFDSKDNIKKSISEGQKVVDLWNRLYEKLGDDILSAECWDFWDDEIKFKASLEKNLNEESKLPSEKTSDFYFGKVILNGSTDQLIMEEDRVLIRPASGGISGFLNAASGSMEREVFYEDIRPIILYEGTTGMGAMLGNKNISPYLKIDLKGTDTDYGNKNDYSVAFISTQLDEARAAKKLIEARKKEINKNTQAASNSVSIADELLKLSKLKKDGLITDEEFVELKKKLL